MIFAAILWLIYSLYIPPIRGGGGLKAVPIMNPKTPKNRDQKLVLGSLSYDCMRYMYLYLHALFLEETYRTDF